MSEHVSVNEDRGVVEIRLNRTEKKNALTGAMYQTMTSALAGGCGVAHAAPRLEQGNDAVRVFLITAEGSTFSAGNDIGDFLRASGEAGEPAASRFIHQLVNCTKPIVAAVQGAAVGIGTTMLLHCDLVYASPDASLSVPFVSMGLVPEAGSSLLLPRLLGAQRAARLLLLGEAMVAEQALQAGLVTEIVSAASLQEHARGKAIALAAKPPMALSATRALMRGGQDEVAAQMRREFEAFARALRGVEAREAFTAFMEKRPPDFSKVAV